MANEEEKVLSFDAMELTKYQPNRYPFLLIDRVTACVPGKYAKGFKNLTWNEWWFPVHFPGNPNMPGCLQVEAMSQMLTVAIMTTPGMEGKVAHGDKVNVAFPEELHPGGRMDIEAEVFCFKRGLCKGHVACYCEGKLIAEMDNTIIVPEIFYQYRPKPVQK